MFGPREAVLLIALILLVIELVRSARTAGFPGALGWLACIFIDLALIIRWS